MQVQLSCYADAIGGDLPTLRRFIDEHLDGEQQTHCCLPARQSQPSKDAYVWQSTCRCVIIINFEEGGCREAKF